MESINSRITTLRKHLKLNQSQFAQKIGVTSQHISMFEAGKANFSETTIRFVCLTFGVNEVWLRTGEGERDTPRLPSLVSNGRELNADEQKLLETYDKLIPENQQEVQKYATERLELQKLRLEARETSKKEEAIG